MKQVSVVIPVFEDAACLEDLTSSFAKVEDQLKSKQVELEYIFIDDGSADETWQTLKALKQNKTNVTIIKLSRNFGAVAASNAGMKYVNGEAFTIYAADMQDPPELVLTMVDKWLEGYKHIICQRNSQRKDPLPTKIFASIYYRLVKFLLIPNYPKNGFDIMFWDSQFLPLIRDTSKNINRSLYAHWLGVKPFIIQYDRPERGHGNSKWSMSKKIKLFIDSFLGFSIAPMRMAVTIGVLGALLSFVYGVNVAIGALLGKVAVPGYASTIIIMSFLFSIVIGMLGVIGEYIWRIFDELNRRPESVIEEIIK